EAQVAAEALRKTGQHQAARRYYELAIETEPERAAGYYGLALALALEGKVDAAIPHLQKAVSLDPADADSHLLLGLLLQRAGQEAAASSSLERAAKVHRLDLLTGRSLRGKLATLESVPGLGQAVEAYQARLLTSGE
ncbi:MAG: tetratricopeptide repeat protein, partial [Acidobacteriota bacterium]